jgi:hypothetical protein
LNQEGLWQAPRCDRGIIISNNYLSGLHGDFQSQGSHCNKTFSDDLEGNFVLTSHLGHNAEM